MEEKKIIEENEIPELFVHHELSVDKGQEPLRIDKYLMNFVANASRNKIQIAAKAECVLVNGKPVKPNYRVRPNDQIKVVMPNPIRDKTIIPEDIPLDIVHEDNDLMVVMKRSGMVVHPGHGNYSGTLVNALAYHMKQNPLPDRSNDGDRPGLVHRLDKDTTGLMVIAKTDWAMTHLAKQFFDRTVHRRYVALVWGDVLEDEGTIEGHIGRHPKNRMQMTVFPDGEEGKQATTTYKVLERFGYVTLVECRLLTGRTHQIRVHFKHLGHPLFSDARYGGDRIVKGTVYTKYKQFVENAMSLIGRQALHAKELGFIHPETLEQMKFDSAMPADMEAVLDKWRRYVSR